MRPRFFRMLRLGLLSLAAAMPGHAQKLTVIPLLPAANWSLAHSRPLDLNAVRQYGQDPVIDREYGVKSAEIRTYQLGQRQVEVLVEHAMDSLSTYGLLTYYQSETTTPEKNLELTLRSPNYSLMARGKFFVRALRPSGVPVSDDELRALLVFIGGTRPSRDALAGLPVGLPAAGLVAGSEKYVLGLETARKVLPGFRTDLIGFANGAELRVASYAVGKQQITALVISYPTPQTARLLFGAMEKFLAVNQNRGAASTYGKRNGSYVFLALDAETPAAAHEVLDKFSVTKQVSWNERYPGDKPIVLQLLELILGNIAFVLILVVMCIMGGLLIVASRRIAAKWFPESSWGHPDEGTIIQLNLK